MRGKNRKITIADVYDRKNVELAVENSRKNKKNNYGVRLFDKNKEKNINKICDELKNRTYKVSTPKLEKRFCINKWRVLAKVTYYDNVVEHALMQVIGPILDKSYYYESAASIKGRGVDYLVKHVKNFISLNSDKDLYAAEIDFVKCYHYVVREKIYNKLCHEFNDDGIRYLIHDIIYALGNHNGLVESDGKTGVGLGLYPVQPFVNFHFNDLDRELAKIDGIKPFRYSDNILIIGFSPENVQKGIDLVIYYAKYVLEQPIHENIGIQKITKEHGILFIGRRFYNGYTKISNKTKIKIKRKDKQLKNNKEQWHKVMSSYKGMLEHVDGLYLWRKITGMNKFSDFNFKVETGETKIVNGKKFFNVQMINCSFLTDKKITILDYENDCDTKNGKNRTIVMVDDNGKKCKFCTNNPTMKNLLNEIADKNGFPFETIIRMEMLNDGIKNYYFT